jgi:hypothetical protein
MTDIRFLALVMTKNVINIHLDFRRKMHAVLQNSYKEKEQLFPAW